MQIPGRQYSAGSGYRYGFNRKEEDDEVKGEGNSLDFGARIYDPRIGRWVSVDPLQSKYPSLSPYNYVANSPINAIDPDGRLIIFINGLRFNEGATDQRRRRPGIIFSKINPMPGVYPEYRAGALRDYWVDKENSFGRAVDMVQKFQERIQDYNAVFVSGSAEHPTKTEDRFNDGVNNAMEFHAKVQSGEISLANDETIKIVTHSQGAAHGEGFAKQLMKYKDDNGNPLYKIEVIYNVTPHQPTDISNPEGVRGVQYSHPNDAIASAPWYSPISLNNGISSFGKIKGITEFDGRTILGGPGQPKGTGAAGNRNGHNVGDNDFIFGIAPNKPGYIAPRKDKPKTP